MFSSNSIFKRGFFTLAESIGRLELARESQFLYRGRVCKDIPKDAVYSGLQVRRADGRHPKIHINSPVDVHAHVFCSRLIGVPMSHNKNAAISFARMANDSKEPNTNYSVLTIDPRYLPGSSIDVRKTAPAILGDMVSVRQRLVLEEEEVISPLVPFYAIPFFENTEEINGKQKTLAVPNPFYIFAEDAEQIKLIKAFSESSLERMYASGGTLTAEQMAAQREFYCAMLGEGMNSLEIHPALQKMLGIEVESVSDFLHSRSPALGFPR